MLAKSETATEQPAPSSEASRVAILMCTRNGARFLEAQLESIATQSHANWSLTVSDDGSTDATREILQRFADTHPGRVKLVEGPRQGACANFIALAADPAIDGDYFAFSDQDDIWAPDKLRRALDVLSAVPPDQPAMYCGRTALASEDGQVYGLSPLFSRPPSFQNALVQSLAGGNTTVFNRATKNLLELAGRLTVVSHDWWVYQLVSATGGLVHYDAQPVLKYRQHADNVMGANLGLRNQLIRLRLALKGRFRQWNVTNRAALEHIPDHMIDSHSRTTIALFQKARESSLPLRLLYLWRSGVYRQTFFGNLSLIAGALLNRI